MTALPSHMYRDPLEILEQAERRSCKGCIFKARMLGRDYCENEKRTNGNADRRCKFYDTGEEK